MNFGDTADEAALRARARAFLDTFAPRFALDGAGGLVPDADVVARAKAWQACKREHGWACAGWPRQFGGADAPAIARIVFAQEERRFATPPDLFVVGTEFMAPAIMIHGTAVQQDRYLERIARGDEIWCQLFSEPAAGSDLAGLRTAARRQGDDWVLNGQKNWTTGAQIADFGVIVTRTDPAVPKHRGLTCFIVDMRAPGITIRPIRQIDGGADFNEVFLSDVLVADADRLGAAGEGWAVALTILMNERYTLGGGDGVQPEHLLELAHACGVGDARDVRQRVADFHVRAAGLRYTRYRIMTALSRGATPGPEASIAKLVGARLQQEMAAFGLDLQGASGVAPAAAEWRQHYLATPGMRIAGGTDEIMRNVVAERVLGLPPEPRVDKDVPFRDVPSAP